MTQGSSDEKNPGVNAGDIRKRFTLRVLYLFAGAERKTSVIHYLTRLAEKQGWALEAREVDLKRGQEFDLTQSQLQDSIIQDIEKGLFHCVICTPPCSTWSRVRMANMRGPPPLRSKEHLWGYPWVKKRFQVELELGNELVRFSIRVWVAVGQNPRSFDGLLVFLFGEHPEDLGRVEREEDGLALFPASIWQIKRLREFVEDHSNDVATVAICQCCWGAPWRKPTRLLANSKEVKSWGPNEWPTFDAQGNYIGPLTKSRCNCQVQMSLAKRATDREFRTTGTDIYPPAMDQGIADAIVAHMAEQLAASGRISKEGTGMPPEEERRKARKSSPVDEEVHRKEDKEPGDRPITRTEREVRKSNPGDREVHREEDEEPGDKQITRREEGDPEDTATPWEEGDEEERMHEEEYLVESGGVHEIREDCPGHGLPIRCYYKGKYRTIHDGGGLTSPGRWPVKKRRCLSGADGVALASCCKKMFKKWLQQVDNGAEKGVRDVFWSMAGGKVKDSPFGDFIGEARKAVDEELIGLGLAPSRRDKDRPSEVNFRRLEAMLRAVNDVDCAWLKEVAEEGVSLGVDEELPRVERVFEEKEKWNLSFTEEDFQDITAENYKSAEENSADIRRQVMEEVELGSIIKMSEEEAKKTYQGRLAVAALGAVPKEIGSSVVRIVHDGSYSVDVNHRIKVRDRLRFPTIDDASGVLQEAEDEVEEEKGAVRFSMLYDVSRAHKLLPVKRKDWGLQSFKLPGENEDGSVFMHTRRTFGIASAAYWWQRLAACLVRLAHNLSGHELGILHLLFADDGWMLALGGFFWRKLLFWLFVLDICEVPLSWKKVRGGLTVQWIGYQLDVKDFKKGISQKKVRWMLDWYEKYEKSGGILGRDMKSALGRFGFVAGALQHVRPFLGPMFAWSSRLAPGTYAKFS